MTDKVYTADVLTEMAEKFLREHFPDAIIMREFNAAKWGNALIDVVAVTKRRIIGIEIKGQGDSLTRLKLQGPAYSLVASDMYLLCCPELQAQCEKKDLKPYRWKYLKVNGDDIEWDGWGKEKDFANTDFRTNFHPNSPRALCSLLWKKELVRFGKSLRCDVTQSMSADGIIDVVSEIVPLREIRSRVIEYLWARDWSHKNHVSDPRIPKQIKKPESIGDMLDAFKGDAT